MKRISIGMTVFCVMVGFMSGGCATTDHSMKTGGYDTPSRLWGDDFAFRKNSNGLSPDWEILDISQESFDRADENWDTMGSDLFDIAK